MELPSGSEFAGFTIVRPLGSGGMGTVYLARHPRLDREVALKVLNDALAADPRSRTAFDREAAVAARLEHPNIVAVYDRSEPGDRALWLSMRHIPGGDTLRLLADAPGGLPVDLAVSLIADAAHALDYAHRSGVQHRDVKPANLLIEHDPRHGRRAVLTDFGIARTLDDTVTLSGVCATFAYAAPERFTAKPADHRADIYSLGCTLFQFLTGRTPFARADQAAVIGAHLMEPPPATRALRRELPAGVDAVIATALAKNPGDRYPTCAALIADLTRALAPPAPPPVPIEAPANVPASARTGAATPADTVRAPVAPHPKTAMRQSDPQPPERGRSRRRRLTIAAAALLVVGIPVGLLVGYGVIRGNYYVGTDHSRVVILRGLPGSVLGFSSREVEQIGCVTRAGELQLVTPASEFPSGCKELKITDLRATGQYAIGKGLPRGSREDALKQIRSLVEKELLPPCEQASSAGHQAAPPSAAPSTPATTVAPATGVAAQSAGQDCRMTG
ncbi:serine/threonine-protein kinase [Nocardia inohanensis]|uniref:serine/threonine-protein kinase n=1 Tax=Nocardia inohanensis TaxID=209246 RepID=UPI000A8B1688|nr:serine/threonine-protein kinase [Nocardia inohanensis]